MARLISIKTSLAAVSAAVLLAACGSGSNYGSTLTIEGVAATGAAIPNAPVRVDCVEGTPEGGLSDTTDANGNYTLTIPDAVSPCLVAVTVPGSDTVLRGFIPAGAEDNAVANVNQLTEAIVTALVTAKGATNAAGLLEAATQPTATDLDNAVEATIAAINEALQAAGSTTLLAADANLLADPNFTIGAGIDLVLDALDAENLLTEEGALDPAVQEAVTEAIDDEVDPNPSGGSGGSGASGAGGSTV